MKTQAQTEFLESKWSLRVDGVDTDLLDRTASPPTAFNPNKRVTLP